MTNYIQNPVHTYMNSIIKIPRGVVEHTGELVEGFLLSYLHDNLKEDGRFPLDSLIKDFHLGMKQFRDARLRWKHSGILDFSRQGVSTVYQFNEPEYERIEGMVEGNLLLDPSFLPLFNNYLPTTIMYSTLQYVMSSELEEDYVEEGYIQYRFPLSVLKDVFKMEEGGATLSYRKIKNIDPKFKKMELYGTK